MLFNAYMRSSDKHDKLCILYNNAYFKYICYEEYFVRNVTKLLLQINWKCMCYFERTVIYHAGQQSHYPPGNRHALHL